MTIVDRASIHVKISAPMGTVSAYTGETPTSMHTPACNATSSPTAIASNASAQPRKNGSAAKGTTQVSSSVKICAHATGSRNPEAAKKFFVVPRTMLPTPACQRTLTLSNARATRSEILSA